MKYPLADHTKSLISQTEMALRYVDNCFIYPSLKKCDNFFLVENIKKCIDTNI